MNAKKRRPVRDIVTNVGGVMSSASFQAKRFKPSAVNKAPTLEKKLPAKSQFELKLSKMKSE